MFKALLSQASPLDSACLKPLFSHYSSCVDVKALSRVDVKALSSVDFKALSRVPNGAYGVSRALCSIRRSGVCCIRRSHTAWMTCIFKLLGLFRGTCRCVSGSEIVAGVASRHTSHATRLTPHDSQLTPHDSRLATRGIESR